MTITTTHIPIRIACPHCGDPADIRRGPRGLDLACRSCDERDEIPFANVCRVCLTGTDGRLAHEGGRRCRSATGRHSIRSRWAGRARWRRDPHR